MYTFTLQNFIFLVNNFCEKYLLLYNKGSGSVFSELKTQVIVAFALKGKNQTWLATKKEALGSIFLSKIDC